MADSAAMAKGVPLKYHGDGGTLFGMYLVNVLLSAVTLGIYSFWGKAKILAYNYGEAEVAGSPFAFHGTGKEFFVAFLKFLGIMIAFYILVFLAAFLGMALDGGAGIATSIITFVLVYAFILALVPIAINSRQRYRMSRTSWRGITLGFDGTNKELMPLYVKGLLLSLVTLGLYSAWFAVRLRKYMMSHTRFGDLRFEFDGEGKDFFFLNLKGILLSVVTLGIYGFWYARNLYRFNIGHVVVIQGERRGRLSTPVTPGAIFKLLAVNLLLAVFTLGIAYPWIVIRSLRFVFDNIVVEGELEPDAVTQGEGQDATALGETFTDFLDLGDFGLI